MSLQSFWKVASQSQQLAPILPSAFTIARSLHGIPYYGPFGGGDFGAYADRLSSARKTLADIYFGDTICAAIASNFLPGDAMIVSKLLGCDENSMRMIVFDTIMH